MNKEGLAKEVVCAGPHKRGDAPPRVVFVMPVSPVHNVRSVHKQAWTLSAAGFEVILVSHSDGIEQYLGMRVVQARATSRGLLRPLLNLPSLLRQSLSLDGDVYVLLNPDTILLAFLLRAARKRVIYDTQEDFSRRPYIRNKLPSWLRGTAATTITWLEKLLARTTVAVVVSQTHQPSSLGGRTLYLPNAPLTRGPIVETARRINGYPKRRPFTLVYAGIIAHIRGISTMLDLVAALNQDSRCRLLLMGELSEPSVRDTIARHSGSSCVEYIGVVSHSEALAHMASADVGLALLDRVADFPTSSITKLYEYMSAGIPFLASDFERWRVDTPRGSPGLYVDPAAFDDICDAARSLQGDAGLRRRMGQIGRDYVHRDFNWDLVSQPFVDLVRKTVPDRSGLTVKST